MGDESHACRLAWPLAVFLIDVLDIVCGTSMGLLYDWLLGWVGIVSRSENV
jgi:hypothetical protein